MYRLVTLLSLKEQLIELRISLIVECNNKMSKPKYDYLGERIDDDYYTRKQKKRDYDAVTILKWIAYLGGTILAVTYFIQFLNR